jgi:hypothetical protein
MNPIQGYLVLLTLLLTMAVASAQEVQSGAALLRAMHDRYQANWYETLTFTQKSTTYKPDGSSSVETWYEALQLPGKLRIDVGPPRNGNGFVLVDGTVKIFKDGKESGTRPLVNILLVLGFDVYRQPPQTTANIVKSEGYDLTKMHQDTWEGQPAYVVGADKGDLNSKQFWVEKNRLLFLRVIEPSQGDPKKMDDIRFTDYRKLASGWVAARVEVYSENRKVFSEDYSDIQSDLKLDPAVFDPVQFNSTHWEKP